MSENDLIGLFKVCGEKYLKGVADSLKDDLILLRRDVDQLKLHLRGNGPPMFFEWIDGNGNGSDSIINLSAVSFAYVNEDGELQVYLTGDSTPAAIREEEVPRFLAALREIRQ